jgi:hypothetical protein
MSSPSHPSGSSSYGTTRVSAPGSNAEAATTSPGKTTSKSSGFSSRTSSAIFPPISTSSAEILKHAELVLDLGTARNEHERPLDIAEKLAQLLQLPLEEQARISRQKPGDRDGRRVGAVGRAERVVDVEVAVIGELTRERAVVLRLTRVETRVLEHGDPIVREELP